MDSSAAPAVLSFSLSPAPDDPTRAKFLCRFGGWVLPRPPDGKLQYVGGETRIVSVPRSVTYGELMARARELFEGTWSLKYQQPGEDVDALVSVVDDHDVANMMEEHDKLGAGRDGPRRLRVFLFSRADCFGGGSASAMGAHDEREAEKRYVDALNGLTDGDSQVPGDVVGGGLVDGGGIYGGGDAGFHGLFKPHHLDVALQHSDGQRYKDMEGPWSPASCSPGLRTPRDPPEFPPSSRQCDSGFGEANDRTLDEYVRQLSPRQALQYEHQPFFVDDAVWMPPGYIPGEKAGFPGDLGNMHNFYESDCVCDHCRMAFQRNQAAFPEDWIRGPWRHRHPQLEQLNKGSGFQSQERGWILQQHLMNHSPDEAKRHQIEYFAVDNNGMKLPFAYDNFYDRHSVTPNCNSHGDPGYVCSAAVLGNAVYNDQQLAGAGTCMRVQDKRAHLVKSPVYGSDDIYQVEPGSSHITSLGRKMQGVCSIPSHVVPGLAMRTDGALNVGYIGNTQDGSPRFSHNGVDAQIPSPWVVKSGNTSQKIFPVDDHLSREYYYDHASKSHQGNEGTLIPEAVPRQCGKGDDYSAPNGAVNVAVPSALLVGDRSSACPPPEYDPNPAAGADITIPLVDEIIFIGGAYETNDAKVIFETSNANVINGLDADKILANDKQDSNSDPKESWTLARGNNSSKFCFSNEYGPCEQQELSAECLTFLPELIDSVKKATLEDIEMLKLKTEANVVDNTSPDYGRKKSSLHSSTHVVASAGVDVNLDTEHMTISKIEPTMAEAEALDKGLQSIKNADLEEIRELGSGAYGSVYHGKWKGCDVAIKRIKASCFAGRPSERERLIADFWKEALIMSSLHHPNIVSFYGIVRDGPDGSLATVTEFMVNGSLKQFLQKKDRSIDRRKRLIIAMDVAFGMEYLHGKNIVHFDLKCENLLVNMRDPHRPVCKIGDLGLSKVRQKTLVSGGVRGTLPWMAPELLSGKSNMVTEKIDVYSFGIAMWELLTGEEPYSDMHCASIIGGIVNNTLRPQIPTWCDPEWKALMESCWSSDPGDRPSFSEISQKLRKMAAAINVK